MGTAIGFTRRSLPLSLLLANIVMLFAYGYHTLMAGTFPLSGGKYAQGAVLQPPLLAGVTAVTTIIKSMSIAGFALSIVIYAGQIFPEILPYGKLIAILIQTVFFASTIKGSKFMAKLNIIMIIVLTIALSVFIAVGIPQVQSGAFALSSPGYFRNGIGGFVAAVAIMGFACQGSTMLVNFASDAEKPTRRIPIAILLTTLVVGLIYFLMAIVAVGILPVDRVAGQSLAVVAEEMFPRTVFVIFVIGGACFAIATSLYGTISTLKYPILSTVEDGWLPAFIGKKTKSGYPWVIMLIMYLVAVIPVIIDMSLDQIASYLMIPIMFLAMLNNILFFKIPKQYPSAWKKSFFYMPGPCLIFVIVFSVLCDVLVCAAMFTTLQNGDQFMIIFLLALIFAYSYLRLKSGKVTMKSVEEAKRQAMGEIYETEQT